MLSVLFADAAVRKPIGILVTRGFLHHRLAAISAKTPLHPELLFYWAIHLLLEIALAVLVRPDGA